MTGSTTDTAMTAEACGCCEDTHPQVPRPRDNPPGQSRLQLRVGTQAALKAAMLARVGRTGALRRLTLRKDDDPTIALIDGWASVLDILAFYQEEIANEGYLRTAEERFSLLKLAGGIGYRLLPGVGSSTYLAFECETTPATPEETVIPAGTQAQSTPAPDETAQIFETKEEIAARPAWNALRARLTDRLPLVAGVREVYLKGTSTGLAPGQPLLFLAQNAANDPANARFDLRWIQSVETFEPPRPDDPRAPYTKVRLDRTIKTLTSSDKAEVYALRQRAAAFGHNAMKWTDLPLPLRVGELHPNTGAFLTGPYAGRQNSWADANYSSRRRVLFLDQVYARLVAGSWIALTGQAGASLYQVKQVKERSHTDYLVSAKVSRLRIAGGGIENFSPRTLSVWCESELLEQADMPLTTAVDGDRIVLNDFYDGLAKGRWVAVTGTSEADGSEVGEVVQVKAVALTSAGSTRLEFETALKNSYDRLSLRVNANVAAADLGAHRGEILGDGDAAVPFKRFTLQSTPLTYVSAKTASGAASTLDVRVDGQLWQEAESFYGHGPKERIYTLTHADDGTATVQFGDGLRGARPASGSSNVTASLRVGIGTDGNLPAKRIDQLPTRPLGVKGVINPVPAEGAADPESMDDARRNAGTHVRMVERIVSLRDYEDFASGFAGIGKALAQPLWSARLRLVHVTVAAADGTAVLPGTTLYDNLRDAMDLARHADEPVQLESFDSKLFTLKADVTVAPDLLIDDVVAAAEAALIDAFSFAQRGFGQAVTKSEIAAVLHGVPGVVGFIVTALHFTGETAEVLDVLPAHIARVENGQLELAELLLIDADSLDLSGAF